MIHAAAECTIVNSDKQSGTACQCLPGFKGQITWSGKTPSGTCTATTCTDLTFDGTINKSSEDKYNSTATFTCNDADYTLNGPESIICGASSANTPWPAPPSCIGVLFQVHLNAVIHFLKQSNELINDFRITRSLTQRLQFQIHHHFPVTSL